jgi:hypothetical protein
MGTKNHIKNLTLYTSSSLKPLAVMLFGFMAIVESCSSSEGESEKQDEHHHVTLARNSEEKMPLRDLISEEELQYDAGLLVEVEAQRAQSQMSAIIRFVSLSTKPALFETYQKRCKAEGIAEEQIGTVEALKNYLKEQASKGVFENPTLAAYLKNVRMKNGELIGFAKKLLDQRRLLLDSYQSQSKTIENLLEQVTMHQKKNDELSHENKSQREAIEEFSRQLKEQQERIDELSREIPSQREIAPNIPRQVRTHNEDAQPLQKPDHFQKYIISFTLGASVATLCYLGYYRFRKNI